MSALEFQDIFFFFYNTAVPDSSILALADKSAFSVRELCLNRSVNKLVNSTNWKINELH